MTTIISNYKKPKHWIIDCDIFTCQEKDIYFATYNLQYAIVNGAVGIFNTRVLMPHAYECYPFKTEKQAQTRMRRLTLGVLKNENNYPYLVRVDPRRIVRVIKNTENEFSFVFSHKLYMGRRGLRQCWNLHRFKVKPVI